MDSAGWTSVGPPESCPDRAQAVWFHRLHRRDPSAMAGPPASAPTLQAAVVPEGHRDRCQPTGKKLWPFEHPRQPYESWCSIRRGICQWPAVRFFQRAGSVWMHFHRGRVQREGFDLDAHDLLQLQLLENSVQNAILGPAIHARVNRVPVAKPARKTAPFASLLGHIQNCIEYLKVRQPHVAALNRQAILNLPVLLRCDLH